MSNVWFDLTWIRRYFWDVKQIISLFCQAHWWKVHYINIQKLSSNINLIFPKLSGIVYKGLHHHSNNNSNQQDSSKIWIIQIAIEVTEIPTGIGVWWFEIVTIQVRKCRGGPIKIGHKLKNKVGKYSVSSKSKFTKMLPKDPKSSLLKVRKKWENI